MNNNITLNNKIITVIENNGFSITEREEQNGEYYIEINQYTPAGEDWWETIWFDGTDEGFIKAIKSRACTFDIDEEAEIWLEYRGKRGVPNSIETIVNDQKWKQKILRKLSIEFNK